MYPTLSPTPWPTSRTREALQAPIKRSGLMPEEATTPCALSTGVNSFPFPFFPGADERQLIRGDRPLGSGVFPFAGPNTKQQQEEKKMKAYLSGDGRVGENMFSPARKHREGGPQNYGHEDVG
ncbi:hypothetical protein ZHAS_00015724 [Anopheles sinensis]|uniref:Uncharacterized protein n=1 Tax=Anopheles sinensis TaxID=74873 RepID=A0A084WBT5_ANOSI|nr:hypothetical protein ZHAS_00015724 [Anopheles sinensis]